MTGLRDSPRLIKGGLVMIAPESGAILRRVVLQYNPDTITRTLQLGAGGDNDLGPLRTRVPPTETFKLDAELDAADLLEHERGASIAPQIAALEALVAPSTGELRDLERLAARGTLEIFAPDPPLVVFVWSARRIVPVRITELTITEEAFDPELQPLRAKVGLGMRVLGVHDLGMDHRGGGLFMVYQRQKERLAALAKAGALPLFDLGRERT